MSRFSFSLSCCHMHCKRQRAAAFEVCQLLYPIKYQIHVFVLTIIPTKLLFYSQHFECWTNCCKSNSIRDFQSSPSSYYSSYYYGKDKTLLFYTFDLHFSHKSLQLLVNTVSWFSYNSNISYMFLRQTGIISDCLCGVLMTLNVVQSHQKPFGSGTVIPSVTMSVFFFLARLQPFRFQLWSGQYFQNCQSVPMVILLRIVNRLFMSA